MSLFSKTPPLNEQLNQPQATPAPMPQAVPTEKITTMPENYLQPVKMQKSIPWLWWALGGGVVVISAALAAYFLLQPAVPVAPTTNQQQTTNNTQPTTSNEPANSQQPNADSTATAPVLSGTPISRDQQRYFDIKQISSALELYYSDLSSYPIEPSGRPLAASIGSLTNVGFRADSPVSARIYLKQLPTPPGGDAYLYKSADGKDYQLTFTLENGIAKLAAGSHVASRGGIDIDFNKNEDGMTSKIYSSTLDSDNDLLTDTEEELYVTNSRQADTDGDGYADGHEIENNYNPLLAGSAKWRESGKVLIYTNANYSYSLIYPAKWTAPAADIQNKEVMFVSADEQQYLSIKREDNPKGLTPLLWYQSFGKKDGSEMRAVKISSLNGLISPDGLNLYLGGGEGKPMYVFSYHPGLRSQLDYFFTFTMMQNSFLLSPTNVNSQNQNTNPAPSSGAGGSNLP